MSSFERLQTFDENVVDGICISLRKAYNPSLSRYFIYQDLNFKQYFLSLINNDDVYIFYSVDSALNRLTSFAFFEVNDKILSLRNIIVDHKSKAPNIGAQLFATAIKDIGRKHTNIEVFQLDVFEQNTGAYNWYLSIGLIVSHNLYWYDISNLFKHHHTSLLPGNKLRCLSIETDNYGFKQLIYENEVIGSLINSNSLVIKCNLTSALLSLLRVYFKDHFPLNVCLISNIPLDFYLIDRSIQLVTTFDTLYREDV